MPSSTRTFIAIELPEGQRVAIARLQQGLAAELQGVRWVDSPQLHITLVFLGDVLDGDLVSVCEAVEGAASGCGPLDLTVAKLGAFPSPGRAQNVWVGVAGPGMTALGALQRAIAQAVKGLGYPREADRFAGFTPHVTIGRIKTRRGPDLRPLVKRMEEWSGGSFAAPDVVTFASKLGRDGPSYSRLATAALVPEKNRIPD
jgi:2'-5' RNA ligase